MELVDTPDLKSCGPCARAGSIPASSTKKEDMKKVFYATVLSVLFLSCKGKTYKYKIEGQVPVMVEKQVDWNEVNVTQELRPAIAYTDTIYGMNKDSIWYYNTDGSKLTIHKPYTVRSLK